MLQKVVYICAELRKPVEDTVYRNVLSKKVIGDIGSLGYVYFVEMYLPPGLSTNPSLTFIKIGKSGDPGVRLSNLQTANPFELTLVDYISVTHMGQAEDRAHNEAQNYYDRGEWYRFPRSAKARLMIRRIRQTLHNQNLIRNIKKSNITWVYLYT